ncbi:cellulase family glycosylhydrolase [Streptomyces sp. N2-109]|uniref:Endoglucanase n=1 Tax=Streptomyces gossypii TaxID=2883101 RepID=A0ABT2K1X6_9ACTN|nr:cellulase family glycosylhydrolase [Streptomyces gossypii]MCT2594172.1 cellulase family glycosylhydrolase [Streptomyces gossypii]
MRTARSTTRKNPVSALLTGLATFLGLVLLGALFPVSAQAQPPGTTLATGLHISDGRLVEGNGNDFVMRGVNDAHTWYPGETQSLSDIKAQGANTVRVVLSNGHRWSENGPEDVAGVVDECKANRLICVLEVHDTTGYGEEAAAASLDQAADYWIGLQDVLTGEENYIIINIGNEPWGNTNPEGWTDPTIAAVEKLRATGFEHTIMVDAPNWGQDWQGVMRANAQSVYDADPTGNLIFSIHMYSVYDTAAKVSDYLNAFVDAGLPLLIGEFGGPPDQYGDPDEDAMMAAAEQLQLGYLAWSWSGNTDPILDLVIDYDPDQLSSWGERIFHGANGIAQTAREATIFDDGGPSDTQAPTAPGTPTASTVTATSVSLSWSAATDNVGVTGYDIVRVDGDSETTVASSVTNAVTVSGLTAETAYTFAAYARDAAGNRSARSDPVSVTTDEGGSTPGVSCSVRYSVVGEWGSGFQGEITIRNSGTTAISDWTLGFAFADGQTVTNAWGGSPTQDGGTVSIAAAPYTSTIPATDSVTVGFTASKGTTNAAPTAFTLSGTPCTTA